MARKGTKDTDGDGRFEGPGLTKPLCTARHAAHFLGVSPKTVYALTSRGALPHVRIGSAIRIRWVDIEDFVRRHRRVRS